ncbi:acyltransferase family protein [Francisella philomiragia]|uniref:acyltransferase family protein n=1 Tax=Francisella philomiragia TaxID=28110 RepID=UPI0019086254|nr:acyltransferase [Francisella philomiragia]MBK2092324.1 acyltransferase [Francisella philomiragia]MBK2257398.1 acyltransferase [Francisella philomiragia]MBK2270102.1 acyltransferase [Francisella philomiragia]MBK2271993.1 acyltransferase [Francisella philomiragia]MBK2275774.1 acyltransferase [Francisella philomiragia]
MQAKDKNVGLQVLRGLAAWLVVFHHYNQLLGFRESSLLEYFLRSRGQFGVDIFFVLSGFLMYMVASKSKSNTDFLLKRISRVFPAYIFFTLLLASCLYILPHNDNSFTSFNLKSLFLSCLMIPNQNPSGIGYFPLLTVGWTLTIELCFYLIVYFSLVLNRKYFFFLVILFSYMAPDFINILGIQSMYTFIYGFIFAYIYQRSDKLRSFLSRKEVRVIIVIVFIILFSGAFGWFLNIKSICALLVLMFFLEVKDNIATKFSILGDISYSTYLFHTIPMFIIMPYSVNLIGHNDLINVSFVTLLSIVIYLVSILSYKYIEKPFLWKKTK